MQSRRKYAAAAAVDKGGQASHILFKVFKITLFNGADIKVEVANFCAAMDTLIDQDDTDYAVLIPNNHDTLLISCPVSTGASCDAAILPLAAYVRLKTAPHHKRNHIRSRLVDMVRRRSRYCRYPSATFAAFSRFK